ncbi:Acetyltransferase, GNAT family [hydrothermal vent metagenome]|uniref:Acetyltransferase, GNAT family n=1 Tax=hydrothermal vent metagenome TaxID=652676 RepID=A0A3B0VIA7_9ZZZZ
MQEMDWTAVSQIYAEGLATGEASFETAVPDWNTWNQNHLQACRLVARSVNDVVVGWAALTAVSKRPVYEGVAEVSVYVAAKARGQGVGKQLLQTLLTCSEAADIWTLQVGIFPENEASVTLHQRCGFRIVGRRERLAQQNGRWRDVLLLERRSQTGGV